MADTGIELLELDPVLGGPANRFALVESERQRFRVVLPPGETNAGREGEIGVTQTAPDLDCAARPRHNTPASTSATVPELSVMRSLAIEFNRRGRKERRDQILISGGMASRAATVDIGLLPIRRRRLHLPTRRGVGVEIAEDVLNRRQQVLRPPLVGVEDVGVPERREVGAALAVGAGSTPARSPDRDACTRRRSGWRWRGPTSRRRCSAARAASRASRASTIGNW